MVGKLVNATLRAPAWNRPALRLVTCSGTTVPFSTQDTPLSAQSRLTDVYHQWFEPVALQDAEPGTENIYLDMLKYWVSIVNDPPIQEIDDVLIARFRKGLTTATWKRGPAGLDRLLSKSTQAKHMRSLRTMLLRCGPSLGPHKPTKQLITDIPYVHISKVTHKPKPPVELLDVKAIFAASRHIVQARRPEPYLTRDQWQAFFGLLFYTGFRVGTVLKLRKSFLVREDGFHWLDVPDHAVTKTSKAFKKVVHDRLLDLIGKLPAKGNDLLIPWPVGRRCLITAHEKLQKKVGISKPASFHAWRRSHACEVARLGSHLAMELARAALDHHSSKITEQHYCNLEPELVRKLPDLLEAPASSELQLMLF